MRKFGKMIFYICFVVALSICCMIIKYCIVNGQAIMASHTELHYVIASWQFLVAGGAIALFTVIKHTRKWYWFSIPVMLVVFAVSYIEIVSQYPCCSGG